MRQLLLSVNSLIFINVIHIDHFIDFGLVRVFEDTDSQFRVMEIPYGDKYNHCTFRKLASDVSFPFSYCCTVLIIEY